MVRDLKGSADYWSEWVDYGDQYIAEAKQTAAQQNADPNYLPQYLFTIAQKHWHQMLRRYSAGCRVDTLAIYFPGLLDAWECSEQLGREIWSKEQQVIRSSWKLNLDHYISCFWLVGLGLTLDIPDDQWSRLIALIGNEGQDRLLDKIISKRSPARVIRDEVLYPTPYALLLNAIEAPVEKQALLLKQFVESWFDGLGAAVRNAKHGQAAKVTYPYWYKYGDENFAGGAYFGRWCVEAAVAAKVFRVDDALCVGNQHYPVDLIHLPRNETDSSVQAEVMTERSAQPSAKRGLIARLLSRRN
ncbi:DUF1911 domain-containing protein [Stutzerimonas zhaodongensis]|uniref:DUF1911 domain-containing protein n=1 Tax=Stutzerimonas zhaodongensis TaxID=1176257 RepID=A0A3M2HI38_9GAMM|nr:PoNe immunity protein domain-containing protein [Stutzerimonas zhaodongensis]MCQ4317774.1 PoNi-like cognate immunity protein [Stutzerimonas zhaodongensis]RMH87593.1 DUF1911 domain-containing protein [Stutzerimonas zhaodongensis]